MADARHFLQMARRAPRADVAILLVTFALTVFADLVVAVNIGVILATLHFLRRMSESVEVRQATEEELGQELAQLGIESLPKDVLVYAVEGPFFFGAVENFERALAGTHTDPRVLIIRLRWVPFMDITGLQTLEEAIRDLHRRGVRVILSGANDRVQAKLEKAGVIELVGPGNSVKGFGEALAACRDLA
jgi:SulP family sulfate permease